MRPDIVTTVVLACALLLGSEVVMARWYQVEVLVFRHTSGLSTGGEEWSPIAALPDFSNVVTLESKTPEPIAQELATPAFSPLGLNSMRLAGIASRLRQSDNYDLLLRSAWRQPSYGVARAKRVYLSDAENAVGQVVGGPTPLEVVSTNAAARTTEGILSVKISRLMHIEVDFLYYHEGQPLRIAETRKAKLREIHYFDHPLFGIVVQVSPFVVASVPDTTAVTADEPADATPILEPSQ